jgi:hypothetical protein
MISVWKCPKCKSANKFGESEECTSCKFNLGYFDGDITALISEMDEADLNRQVNSHINPQVLKEEERVGEEEWFCEFCSNKN